LLLDKIATDFDFQIAVKHGWMLPAAIKNICAVALLGLLTTAIISKHRNKANHETNEKANQ
jgi:hypothetical protein